MAIAFAITSKKPKLTYPLVHEPDNLLPKKSWVKISLIRTLGTQRLRKKIAVLEDSDMLKILTGLNRVLRNIFLV